MAATATFSQACAVPPGASRSVTFAKAAARCAAGPTCWPPALPAVTNETPGNPYIWQVVLEVLVKSSG